MPTRNRDADWGELVSLVRHLLAEHYSPQQVIKSLTSGRSWRSREHGRVLRAIAVAMGSEMVMEWPRNRSPRRNGKL